MRRFPLRSVVVEAFQGLETQVCRDIWVGQSGTSPLEKKL